MTRFRKLTLILTLLIMIAIEGIWVLAQNSESVQPPGSPSNKAATISLSIVVPKANIPVGQTPWVLLTVKNLSGNDIAFPEDRVHVEAQNGEPSTTLRQRQLTHKLRAGEPSIMEGGFEPTIRPGASFTRKYDLSELYDLSKPGKYTVYIEVLNMFHANDKGDWLRSPIAHFEIEAPTQ